jgi:nucleoside-diphosphate-sugar epimerase
MWVRVLVTGNEGYLGTVIASDLIRRGHEVIGLDTGYFKAGWLYAGDAERTPPTTVKDIRQVTVHDLTGVDAVVHMAELSNDPLGQLDPSITKKVNHDGSVRLATLARDAGVSRFVYMSSCSVYGVGGVDEVSEETPPNPQTAYATCKVLVERDVAKLSSSEFAPTFLRNATAFGASPRMRFDVVVNNLAGLAWTRRVIEMTSDGTPWRPLVHVLDIGRAISRVLDAPPETVRGEILNVGSTTQNYQIREIADGVATTFPGCDVRLPAQGIDNRSYRVSFAKIDRTLPGFACEWDLGRGLRQLRALFERIDLTSEQAEGRFHIRLKQLEYLIRTRQVDGDLFWRTASSDADGDYAPKCRSGDPHHVSNPPTPG